MATVQGTYCRHDPTWRFRWSRAGLFLSSFLFLFLSFSALPFPFDGIPFFCFVRHVPVLSLPCPVSALSLPDGCLSCSLCLRLRAWQPARTTYRPVPACPWSRRLVPGEPGPYWHDGQVLTRPGQSRRWVQRRLGVHGTRYMITNTPSLALFEGAALFWRRLPAGTRYLVPPPRAN